MTLAPKLPAHGAEIPAIGFGTSGLGDVRAEHIATALTAGYRHIDTARKYGTERVVGEGIRASGVPRADIFLCTKVSHENLHAADFARSVDDSLKALRVDYVDLLLVHWPEKNTPLKETMGALGKAKRTGLTRHIGVANFNIAMLDEAIRLCPEPLVTLQTECHPYLDQTKVIEACRQRGLVLTAYCPLAAAGCKATRCWPRSRNAPARPSRKWRCAGWCSRASSPPFRARRMLRASRRYRRV